LPSIGSRIDSEGLEVANGTNSSSGLEVVTGTAIVLLGGI